MEFRIADTFTDSLARLTGEEQKAVKTTAFDLQLDPTSPGMQFHRLDRAKDKRFWSVRVSRDIRLIVHRTAGSLLLCYVDHHDDAYAWAERRKLEAHPTTGAAQLVEIRETVMEIAVPRYVEVERPAPPKPPLFSHVPETDLLGYGVPPEWVDEVKAATEDTVLALADHLPGEAAEALLELATGGRPSVPKPVPAGTDPFAHPDAQRRFRVVSNADELARALEYPWDRWTVFLHPAQRETVERSYGGPARVSGSAGTGKTIVALHRAVYLARANADARVLLTTFSEPLATALRGRLRRLIGSEPSLTGQVEVHAIDTIARRLYERAIGPATIVAPEVVRDLLSEASAQLDGQKFGARFLTTEWDEVVDAWQLGTWEEYRDVARLGRKTRLPERQREVLWRVFEQVRKELNARGVVTWPALYTRLAAHLGDAGVAPFDFVVVDEAQDVSVAQLRFLAALGGERSDGLFLAGDLGQRIFQAPFSWKSLGVDVRGRSSTLRINYRTSHQIRSQADRLLAPEVSDVDGNTESRRAVSVFNGPDPVIQVFETAEEESEAVGRWLADRTSEGVEPHEIGVFVRSVAELNRARAAVEGAGLSYRVLDEHLETLSGHASVGTMHLAKGLEFRAVVVMACDDEVIPSQERIETVGDEADLEEVYNTERHLLYVACTRARDHLLVTSVDPPSEFLDDLLA
ncbi:MAG: UvrD-helicase domain-containing protein [Gemmatimonadetes bacterium]|nr:UvrD-helicase domain-containing protein [Gemmatimonadota bacterium]